MQVTDFYKYMKPGMTGHLVGIGGVSMSALAEVLRAMGLSIRGSDAMESPTVLDLREKGIKVFNGHSAGNIEGADFIVRTAAAKDINPEIAAAREAGLPVFERTQAWGAIMARYKNSVCVSGTHGKTTTTSMITHIFMAAEKDPTVMIGGYLPLIESSHRTGEGDTIILESCEYCNSFLSLLPTAAVILNVDEDHLDFFKDLDDIKRSFRKFAELVPPSGFVVANFDDKNTMSTLEGIDKRLVTFGFSEGCDYRAININLGRRVSFDVLHKGEFLLHLDLKISGRHNVYNALAATAAGTELNIAPKHIKMGLEAFTGAGRRLEYKGSFNGAEIYDDYAHHPTEIEALLQCVLSMGFKRILCVFQPHTYSRTKALFDDFVRVLKIPYKVFLAEIYAAREQNTIGISSEQLADKIEGSIYSPDSNELKELVKKEARPGDIIITVGAGDIYKVGERLLTD
jgi:UDP-N-acetylmuramate--alanine ligase